MREPSYIDPAWEYWVGDEEVTELLAETGACAGYDSVLDWRMDKHESLGLRFGRGNPDSFNCFLAPEKLADGRALVSQRNCEKCGVAFTPDRHSRMYCSVECRPRRGREREIPLEAACAQCRRPFEPAYWGQTYCSLTCVGASQRKEGAETGCKVCGKEPPASTSPNGTPRLYCSDACKRVWKQRKRNRRQGETKSCTGSEGSRSCTATEDPR